MIIIYLFKSQRQHWKTFISLWFNNSGMKGLDLTDTMKKPNENAVYSVWTYIYWHLEGLLAYTLMQTPQRGTFLQ